ncbi:MAG: hypothetical protein JWQ76_306 [Ramlibacter sp.]|nr:hypothetical protein [Ramlibacter sp.]
MFNLTRLLSSRRKLEHYWSDTEIAPPDTVMLSDDADRLAAAESEWMIDGLLMPSGGSSQQG